ncbi:Hsp20/alpha crystallin family protein [Halobacterium wangiae]|uniref:Hsp20/alpha crystallin family protein n=1 Tax=Halobacterium wangiae TaxID=2902623 RepID=UPI001E3FA6BA|nr:Hsp20/alpha crystallin family protein [Halobacterium wangiae]
MPANSPFEDIERIVDEMQRRLDETSVGGQSVGNQPSLDVVEYDEEFVVTVDLPGFEAEDVSVELVGRTLAVEAEQTHDETVEEDDGRFIRQERSRSTSTQQVEFPARVHEAGAIASMHNGVLTVTVPKTDPDQGGTRVEIE